MRLVLITQPDSYVNMASYKCV